MPIPFEDSFPDPPSSELGPPVTTWRSASRVPPPWRCSSMPEFAGHPIRMLDFLHLPFEDTGRGMCRLL
jgi:hypothetical protein